MLYTIYYLIMDILKTFNNMKRTHKQYTGESDSESDTSHKDKKRKIEDSDKYKKYYNDVSQNKRSLTTMYAKYRTYEMCLKAVENDGLEIQFVPLETTNYGKLCMKAIQQNAVAIQHISSDLCSEDLWTFAFHQSNSKELILMTHFNSKSLCELACLKNPFNVLMIPKEFETHELFMKMVQNDVNSFRYVPHDFKTQELVEFVVTKDGLLLEHIHHKYFISKYGKNLYKKICINAVKQNGLALEFVPKKFKSKEICDESLKQNREAYKFVPTMMKLIYYRQ